MVWARALTFGGAERAGFGWGFVARYNFYLSLPIVLMCSVGLSLAARVIHLFSWCC